MMFAGDGTRLSLFYSRLQERAFTIGREIDIDLMTEACRPVYKEVANDHALEQFLSKIGYDSVSQFRQIGRAELGDELFANYVSRLETFDLGNWFVVCGFYNTTPYLLCIDSSGIVDDTTIERMAVIGAGRDIARGILHRKSSATDIATLLSLLQNPFFRESKRNRMQYEYESEREPRSILQVPLLLQFRIVSAAAGFGQE